MNGRAVAARAPGIERVDGSTSHGRRRAAVCGGRRMSGA